MSVFVLLSLCMSGRLFPELGIHISLQIAVDIFPVHWATAFYSEPRVNAADMEEVVTLWQHSEVVIYLEF